MFNYISFQSHFHYPFVFWGGQIESEKEIDEDITVQQFLESEYELLEKRIRVRDVCFYL